MDRRTKGTVMTIVGIASLAALGAAIGAASHHRHHGARHLVRRSRRKVGKMADWDAVAGLIERMADALPRRETDRILHRIQSRLKNL